MAGVRLEWAQFGDFDSFSIYRSNAPMDIASLPTALATDIPTMFYFDASAVLGATYYYRIKAHRDADTIISDEYRVLVTDDAIIGIINAHIGYYFNPNFLDTVWQDSAGTVAAAVGMPVGRIDNLCKTTGSPPYAYATSSSHRPTLRNDAIGYYLEFNGSNSLMIDAININSNEVVIFGGYYQIPDDPEGMLLEMSTDIQVNPNSAWVLFITSGSQTTINSASRGDAANSASFIVTAPTPQSAYFVTTQRITPAFGTIAANGVNGTESTSSKGSGLFGSYQHYIGSRANTNLWYKGKVRSIGMVFGGLTSDEFTGMQTELAKHI